MTWEHIVVLATAVVPLAVAFEVWRTRRGRRDLPDYTGRHRPETVVLVDDLHLITYPALFERYRRFVEMYGRGADQAMYWVWRLVRMAELREKADTRRVQRELEADYGWLSAWDVKADLPRELVAS